MRIGKRVLLLLLTLAAIVLSLSGRAMAAETSKETALTVIFAPSGTPARGVEFRLYLVAAWTAGAYTTPEGYPDLPESETAEAWRQYAAALEAYVTAEGVEPAATVFTDGEGVARAEGLSPGLYLVTGERYQGDEAYISPAAFVVSLPRLEEGDTWQYDVTVMAKHESVSVGERLPQTGLVRWPVPVLAGSGLVLLAVGLYRRRKEAGK